MKIGMIALAPVALCASLVWADDSMDRVTPTDQQLLKQCLERQKSTSNVTISKADAKRYCKDQLKHQKETGASSERQPVDTPHDATDTSPPPAREPPPSEPPSG